MSEPEPPAIRAAKRRKMSLNEDSEDDSATANSIPDAVDATSLTTYTANPLKSNLATESGQADDNAQDEQIVETTNQGQEIQSLASDLPIAPRNDEASVNNNTRSRWPPERVPVEIFNIVIRYLSRKDISNMRLVNHEFDSKLAESYFKNLVVIFRPEFEALYGTLNISPGCRGDQSKLGLVLRKKTDESSASENENQEQGNITLDDEFLLSDGHRIFEQFARRCTRKFALALDLNERDLASPPMKLNQKIVSTPWGLYRWPIMDYQRYSQLEGLEQMADETGYMKKAFQHLEQVNEIGISCDAGLGWLHGPDTNPFCTHSRPGVFRPTVYQENDDDEESGSEDEERGSLGLSILKQMAINAGYSLSEWPRVIVRLLQDEGRAVVWRERVSPNGCYSHERIPLKYVTENTKREVLIRHIENLINENGSDASMATRTGGLVPNNLTTAQAEMLLELEWAHRALMQSYRIAVMDNKSSFQHLKKLTIARCPGCHVSTWCDDSFWESMTCIETFHLGVIPDWREITKNPTGAVTQRRVVPTETYPHVFNLLQNYVGVQQNIKHVSFEWVCGGEFAVGKSQRDRYILPAPVLAEPGMMVDVQQDFTDDDVLDLPWVEKLSLKNCWFSPHVFMSFFKHMFFEQPLQVDLESVSLTGPPSMVSEPSILPGAHIKPTHWPWPLCVGAEPGNFFQLQRPNAINNNNNLPAQWIPQPLPNQGALAGAIGNVANGNALLPLPGFLGPPPWAAGAIPVQNPASVPVNHLTAPPQNGQVQHAGLWRAWSWPHVLASLGMAPDSVREHLQNNSANDNEHWRDVKLEERRFSARFAGLFHDRVDKRNDQTMTFKSCGYTLIESPNIDNWEIIPDHPMLVDHSAELPARLRELDTQTLASNDGLLGKIINYIPDEEDHILQTVFGVRFGWQGLYDDIVHQVALVDGNPHPGQARFHGHVNNKTASKAIRIGVHRS